jgi:alpha,alpha-trehalose phosphorylase
VSSERAFSIEPWCLRETRIDLENLGQSESLLALSNGHIGLRGTLDEGEPHRLPGSYLNSFYETRPMPHAESMYGNPESGQTMINITDGKLIRVLVEDEPFDIRYGDVLSHERVMDFREGTLKRTTEWRSPAGQAVRVTSTRLVSLTQRAIVGIEFVIEPLEEQLRIVLQSELVANEELPGGNALDPRESAILKTPLVSEDHYVTGSMVGLIHSTRKSGLRVGAAMDHIVQGPESTHTCADSSPDVGRFTVTAYVKPGEKLRLVKFVSYGWSSRRSLPAVRDQVAGALTIAKDQGWTALRAEQREYLDQFWETCDVEVDGDAEIQQAVRFGLFHMLQASARAERRGIPAKALTGNGYDGHVFWDSETFLLQVLTFTNPSAVADALRWRHSLLPKAKARATELGFQGAAFPWRTIDGEECSGYWPAGMAAFHINADIADAVIRYVSVSGDEDFERSVGIELLVETARLWRSLGQHDVTGKFRIDGVTGPDEYSSIADNNVYTNLMAQRNLRAAADCAAKYLDRATELGVGTEEMASWRDAAEDMLIPFDEILGIHPQSAGFTRHEKWDFEQTPAEKYPLLVHYPYFDLYRKQVVKQADLVLAMQMCPDAFTPEQKRKNFEYYESITTRDSSLSACTQAVIAAEVGHLDLAYDYLGEAALVDLHDLHHNAKDGLHLASLAGTWMVLVMGFGGMRSHNGMITFDPHLPRAISRISFNLKVQGRNLRVVVTPEEATYALTQEGEPLSIKVAGEVVTITNDKPVTVAIDKLAELPRPSQPFGCEVVRREPVPATRA